MTFTLRRTSLFATVFAAATVAIIPPRAYPDDAATHRKFLSEKSSVLVTVKFVLKTKMGGMMGGMGEHETENEVTGVMIDPKGLILCTNSQLEGFMGMMGRMMGPMAGNFSATPTDLKVLVGEDTEGVDAELLARDTELDLAWVKIKDPGDNAFKYLDLSKATEPQIGQRVIAVRRMGKYFGRIAVVAEGRIGGITERPRKLYVPSGDIAMAIGLPVYLDDGRVLGIIVQQMPDSEDVAADPLALMSRMSGIQELMSGLVLPAADVAKATRRAIESTETE